MIRGSKYFDRLISKFYFDRLISKFARYIVSVFIVVLALLQIVAESPTQAQTVPIAPFKDSNGWTVFTPSSDSHIVYVSNSAGNDSTCAAVSAPVTSAPVTPCKTIAKGASLLRSGYPDWLLLKKGDTFLNELITDQPGYPGAFCKAGRSASEPMLISSYGTGARPLLKTKDATGYPFAFGSVTAAWCPLDNFAITGIEFYEYTHDPGNAGYDPADAGGVAIAVFNPTNWFLIEDCKFTYWALAILVEGGSDPTSSIAHQNVQIRRNVTGYQYTSTVNGFASGHVLQNVQNLLVEENISISDGWLAGYGIPRNTFDHGFYLQANTTPGITTVVRGNTTILASAFGIHQRRGGLSDNNLFVEDGIGLDFGYPGVAPDGSTSNLIQNNVVLNSTGFTGGASAGEPTWGVIIYPTVQSVMVTNNIVAHAAGTGNYMGIAIGTTSENVNNSTNHLVTVSGNYAVDWPEIQAGMGNIIDWSTGKVNVVSDNVSLFGSDLSGHGWPDPSRTLETYDAKVLGGPGTVADYILRALAQSKDAWNSNVTAMAVNDYIRAGFGVSAISTGTASSGTTPTGTTPTGTNPTGTTSTGTTSTGTTSTGTTSTGTTPTGTTSTGTTSTGTTSTGTTSTGTTSTGTTSTGTTSTGTTSTGTTAGSGTTILPPPVVAIGSPENGTVVKGNGAVNVAVNASAAGGIASITILMDGTTFQTCKSTTSCSTTLQGKKVSRGTHVITAHAVNTGGQSASAMANITALK